MAPCHPLSTALWLNSVTQQRQVAQQARQQQQKLKQQQIWAKSRAVKPKPIKLKAARRRRVKSNLRFT